MTVFVTLKPEDASCDVQCTSNCEPASEEGLIVNLHPDYPIPEDQLHQDQVFPWLTHVHDIAKKQLELLGDFSGFDSLEELSRAAAEIQTSQEAWPIIKKGWSLTRNGQDELAREVLKKYKSHGYEEEPEINNVLFHFCGTLLLPGRSRLFEEANKFTATIFRNAPEEFHRFKLYFLAQRKAEHMDRYFDIFSEYFRDFGEFTQTLLLCRYNIPLPDNAASSSTAFPRTKMFYGNIYEALTSSFVVLASLDNIGKSRPFDQFEKMDLKKYLTINKAARASPFANTPAYATFAEGLDSGLRNASHHGAIKLDDLRRVISFRSGGTGTLRYIRYAEYLYMCNELLLKLSALLMLELLIGRPENSRKVQRAR